MQQILEGEKKLKFLSALKLISATKGTISMCDFAVSQKDIKQDQQTICAGEAKRFLSYIEDCHEVKMTDDQMKVVVFIAGYAAFRLKKV